MDATRGRFTRSGRLCRVLVLAAGLGAASCQSAGSRDAQVRPEPQAVEALPVADADPSTAPAVQSPDTPKLDVAGDEVTPTLADGEAIKAALLVRLRTQDHIEFRDDLIKDTQNDRPSISEGHLRIGTWAVLTRDDKLVLNYRLPPSPQVMLFYSAALERQGKDWVVGPLVLGHAHRR